MNKDLFLVFTVISGEKWPLQGVTVFVIFTLIPGDIWPSNLAKTFFDLHLNFIAGNHARLEQR